MDPNSFLSKKPMRGALDESSEEEEAVSPEEARDKVPD